MLHKYTVSRTFLPVTGRRSVVPWVVVSALCGCVQPPAAIDGGASVEAKLARVGLELISEHQAGVPAKERGRYVPCRALAGSQVALLPPDPAGYLIVGFDGQLAGDADKILSVLRQWQKGETISFWVRRNPYVSGDPDWWEVNSLPARLP